MLNTRAALLLVCLAPMLAQADDPWGRLKRLFAEPFGVNAECIQRRVPSDGGDPMTVKIDVAKSVGLVSRVIEPTNFQGVVMTDDNVVMRSYYPDESVIFVQPSPGQYRLPIGQRMALIHRNYDIKDQAKAMVASRNAVRLLLVPKDGEMQQRRLTLDAKENFLLRGERFEDDKWLMTVDTVSVTFMPHKPFLTPTFDSTDETKTRESWGPKPMDKYTQALQRAIGFLPAGPADIPHGFAVVEKQVVLMQRTTAAVFRLTDGIANATVYIYRLPKNAHKSENDLETLATGPSGAKYAVVGDIPSGVAASLAEAFANAESIGKEEGS